MWIKLKHFSASPAYLLDVWDLDEKLPTRYIPYGFDLISCHVAGTRFRNLPRAGRRHIRFPYLRVSDM